MLREQLVDLQTLTWISNGYGLPAPWIVKMNVLTRNGIPNATWVESGTFLGKTSLFLADIAQKVYTLEPSPLLFQKSKSTLSSKKNVVQIQGTSEEIFPELCPTLTGNVCFWLDGHFSDGVTYQGSNDTPIRQELEAIQANLENYESTVIFVDDVRCFNPIDPNFEKYPDISWLANRAKDMGMRWKIEYDIFVAYN